MCRSRDFWGPYSNRGLDFGPLSHRAPPRQLLWNAGHRGLEPNTQNLHGHQLLSYPPLSPSLPTSLEGAWWAVSPKAACMGSLDTPTRFS